MNITQRKINYFLWILLFVIITILDTSTNVSHKTINQFILLVSVLFFLALHLGFLESKNVLKSKREHLFKLIIYYFILVYGLFLSKIYGGFQLISGMELIYILISYFFYIYTYKIDPNQINLKPYALTTVFLMIICGSVIILPYPRLDLIMSAEEYRDYSQGVSFVFGIFTIYFYLKYHIDKRKILLILAFLSFIFMALGAARGEFIACIFILLAISLKYSVKQTIGFIFIILITIIIFVDLKAAQNNFLLLQRLFEISNENLGMRDILWGKALTLIYDDFSIFGKGYNYFQVYYKLDSSLYPHNILLEIIISFGLLGLIMSLFCILGALYSLSRLDLKDSLMLFIFLVLMKSGSIFNFFSFAVIFYHLDMGLKFLSKSVNDKAH